MHRVVARAIHLGQAGDGEERGGGLGGWGGRCHGCVWCRLSKVDFKNNLSRNIGDQYERQRAYSLTNKTLEIVQLVSLTTVGDPMLYLLSKKACNPGRNGVPDKELRVEQFKNISLADPFFDSLKSDYPEFPIWIQNKANNNAFIFEADSGGLDGFLYLKEEFGPIVDVQPNLVSAHRLKIGTFKINPHGTRLGERFMKRAFDTAVNKGCDALYVTVFEKHDALVQLFTHYGFISNPVQPKAFWL